MHLDQLRQYNRRISAPRSPFQNDSRFVSGNDIVVWDRFSCDNIIKSADWPISRNTAIHHTEWIGHPIILIKKSRVDVQVDQIA